MKRIALFLLSVFVAGGTLQAGGQVLEIDDIGYEQIYYASFSLKSEKKVRIEAEGAGGTRVIRRTNSSSVDKENMFAYAWIINADSRKMVWRMSIDNTDKSFGSDWNRSFEGNVRLPAGEYEVYFSAVEPSIFNLDGGLITIGKVFKRIFSNSDEWDDDADKWFIRISGVEEVSGEKLTKKYIEKEKEDAILHLYGSRDSERMSRGFTLTKPLNIDIYAIGEAYRGEVFDYGWIIDAQTRERVWTMREADTEHAGGAEKNRMSHEKIHLKAGDYLVYFTLDDSHSPEEWNSNPPYDPFYWGITLRAADKDFEPSIVKKYVEAKVQPVVSIDRVGDYAYKEAGFKLTRDSRIRIYALGEGRDGEMFDYAWITSAKTGEIVWKMRYSKTRHAGGASKNRLFDGVIKLPAGEYIAYYQTDDSHSYEDWNSAAPDDAEMWGVTIYPVGKDNSIKALDITERKDGDILAKLVRIGDDERVRKQFTLDRKTRVRIYCIGEGEWDEMYDYGWIRNMDTDDTVWKMRYRKTEHAGGAKKNRVVDTIMTLDAGTYTVYYRSDGSHSFRDWNDSPPRDERNWGITIYKLDK